VNKTMFLDLVGFFNSIKNLRYFATKIETPFFNDHFPEDYPVGRDVDLICHPEDFSRICCLCEEFIQPKEPFLRRIAKDTPKHFRYRIESANYFVRPNPSSYDKLIHGLPMTKLHFQVDISAISEKEYSCFSDNFISSIFDDLDTKNGINILDKDRESTFRLMFWKKSPAAVHHSDYISKNFDREILMNFRDGEIKEFAKNILERLEKESA